jgi:hypothetical protein
MNLDLVAVLVFLPFFAFRCECFWSMLKTPKFDYTYISNIAACTIIPETKPPLAQWLTRQQASKQEKARQAMSHNLTFCNQPNQPY